MELLSRVIMAEDQFWIGVHGVIAHRGRILILRRAREMIYRPGHWDLPGGHLAIGESFEQCLTREIGEETGLTARIERMIGVNQAPEGPYVQLIYACRLDADPPPMVRLRPSEHCEARWLSVAEVRRLDEPIPYLERIAARGMLDWTADS